jgi:hypothetical protein
MRPMALGRKNYLFAGSDEGGRRAAIMYTLIETARLNDVDPEAWLGDVISRIADHPNTKIDELLPWKWTRAGSQAIAAWRPRPSHHAYRGADQVRPDRRGVAGRRRGGRQSLGSDRSAEEAARTVGGGRRMDHDRPASRLPLRSNVASRGRRRHEVLKNLDD